MRYMKLQAYFVLTPFVKDTGKVRQGGTAKIKLQANEGLAA